MNRIVVPLDGSPFGEHALPYALALARGADAELHLVSVHAPLAADALPEYESVWAEQARQWSAEYLADVGGRVARVTAREPVTALLDGAIAESIEAYAREHAADLVVLATHGRSGLSRAWLGSVADRLIRRLTLPVLAVRPAEDAEPDLERTVAFRKVLVALDGSELAESALDAAVAVGGVSDAEYVLLRVVPPPYVIGSPFLAYSVRIDQEDQEEREAAARRYLEGVADGLRDRTGKDVRAVVRVDPVPVGSILDEAREWRVDLIAMATHGRGSVARAVLGSVADKVLREADCPVLLRHPPRP